MNIILKKIPEISNNKKYLSIPQRLSSQKVFIFDLWGTQTFLPIRRFMLEINEFFVVFSR